eukprot:1829577-Rhodomonas_salina.1
MPRSGCDTAAVIRPAEWKLAPVKPPARGSSSSSNFTKRISRFCPRKGTRSQAENADHPKSRKYLLDFSYVM